MDQHSGPIRPQANHDEAGASLPRVTLPVPGRDSVTVCTLGGVADIGMNWTLYGHDGRYLLVDAGTSFAPRDVDGVEAIFPDPTVLRELGDRLAGMVVTHFHEDHVGAIHRVWPRFLKCPIYAPPFAARMLQNRFAEAGTQGKVKVTTFKPGQDFGIGPFAVRTIPVAHSTPDCVALAVRTKAGTVLHTGDWKIDDRPGIGHPTDLSRFRRLGDSGVDLMLCDSTNADRERPATSEASVERALTEVFTRAKGMVVVCSFGSNVARMASVAKAAAKARRKVALSGRSLRNAAEVAQDLDLLKGTPKFLEEPKDLKRLDRRARALMCTGTQGEENASLTKLAEGTNRRLPQVEPGDVIVHSARTIPGNEEYVDAVLGKLRQMGAEVVTADASFGGDPVHVTGHPCRPDLRRMYEAVRPRIAMPVHGTPSHLDAHAGLAREMGVPAVSTPVNGGVYELKNGVLTALGRLPCRLLAVMGDDSGTVVGWNEAEKRPLLEEAARIAAEAPPVAGRRPPAKKGRPSRNVRERGDRAPVEPRSGQGDLRAAGRRRRGGRERTKGPSEVRVETADVVVRAGRGQRGASAPKPASMGDPRALDPASPVPTGRSLALDAAFIDSFSRRDGGAPRRPSA